MMGTPLPDNHRADRFLPAYQSQTDKSDRTTSITKREPESQSLLETPVCSSLRLCDGKEKNSKTPTKLLPSSTSTKEETCEKKSEELPTSERRQRRKPLHPQRSLSLVDPNFRGVTLCFHTILHGNSSKLVITPIFSKNLARLQRRRHHRRSSSESELDGTHSATEENANNCEEHRPVRTIPATLTGGVKCCASCSTRRTPLWRDAEDGTPLCNACGIRYRKYRLHCSTCWHIPRKDNKVFPTCSQCGGVLSFSQIKKC